MGSGPMMTGLNDVEIEADSLGIGGSSLEA